MLMIFFFFWRSINKIKKIKQNKVYSFIYAVLCLHFRSALSLIKAMAIMAAVAAHRAAARRAAALTQLSSPQTSSPHLIHCRGVLCGYRCPWSWCWRRNPIALWSRPSRLCSPSTLASLLDRLVSPHHQSPLPPPLLWCHASPTPSTTASPMWISLPLSFPLSQICA